MSLFLKIWALLRNNSCSDDVFYCFVFFINIQFCKQFWNLLPSDAQINNKKRDKIPSPGLIERQKDLIVDYWGLIAESQAKRFQKEIQIALLGHHSFDSWKDHGIVQLQNSCHYLIEQRGYEEWKG